MIFSRLWTVSVSNFGNSPRSISRRSTSSIIKKKSLLIAFIISLSVLNTFNTSYIEENNENSQEMPQEKKDGCCSTKHVDVWSRYTAALTGALICAVGVLDIIKVFGGTQT